MDLSVVALLLCCDGLVSFVLGLSAELAHALLLVPAEHFQQPLVLLTHPVLQVRHRLHQLVELQGGDRLMRLQVALAVRGQTHQAGLQSLHLQGRGRAHVTHHLARLGGGQRRGRGTRYDVPKRVRQLFEGDVDAHIRPGREGFAAGGALAHLAAVPHTLEAGLAEVVSAGSGDRVGKHLLTDGALELFFG